MNEPFEKLLNILDASQLRRNLHLTLQLLEYGAPVIIGLNMLDVAKNRGIQIDIQKLSESLGVTVAPVVARTGKGCNELAELVTAGAVGTGKNNLVYYGKAIEAGILKLENKLAGKTQHPVRWLALQLFEGNHYVKNYVATILPIVEIEKLINSVTVAHQQNADSKQALDQVIHRKRSEAIDKIVSAATTKQDNKKVPLTEKVDMVVTNKFLGITIFLVLMYIMFMLTFDWLGFPLSDALDSFLSGPLTSGITAALAAAGASTFIKDLVIDGIVAGVGGVLVFVPQIFILFFFISLLEDSGYMARVALVMDRLM